MLLEETPTVLSLENVLRRRHPPKKARKSSNLANHVPFVVPGLSTSSSTLSSHASATSSSQDTVISTKNPATEGSEIMGEGSRGSPSHESAEAENTNEMKTTKNYEVNYCKMCQNGYKISTRIWWTRMFNRINILPALLMIYQWSREEKWYRAGKHSIKTHFPKDRNDDIRLRTKITRASCRRRANAVMPRPEKFGDLIIADHKIVSEGCESRNNHRYAVVV